MRAPSIPSLVPRSFVTLAAVLLGAAPGAVRPALAAPDARLVSAVAGSGLIFQGTVVTVGAATPSVPVEPRAGVVRVDQVVEAGPGAAELGDLTGKEVTVRFAGAAPKAGATQLFFTSAYWVGASVGLAEVGPAPPLPAGDLAAVKQAIAEARQADADRRLGARLAAATLVIAGTVESVEAPRSRVPTSLHDPLWCEATVRVESVGKGSAGGAVIVYYARSQDTTWAAAPKLRPGQQGVFVLRDGASLARFAVKGPVLLEADDVLPRDATARLKALLAAAKVAAPAAPAASAPAAAKPAGKTTQKPAAKAGGAR